MGGSRGGPVVIGEVLFDVFPDGSRVLGGAPFNVAWHLQALGLAPLMVTRIGDDDAGDQVRASMEGWGMDISGLQVDEEVPTGEVQVTLDDGEPSFEILPDRAWDRLDGEAALAIIREAGGDLLYHGSLVARSDRSAAAVRAVRDGSALPVFVDVNLRDPWWTVDGVFGLVTGAHWVKLNRDELHRLGGGPAPGAAGLERAAGGFLERHGLDRLIVTCGADGAVVRSGGEAVQGRPEAPAEIVDTVGAGDAFSAVWILGLAWGWSLRSTLARALEFAAGICGVRGATTDDQMYYRRYLDRW